MNNRPKKGYGYIYKYTAPSGKSYIGQTVQSLKERAGHNGKQYRNCKLFYNAILKYGLNNFLVEILEEVPIASLDNEEKKFIQIFNSLSPNGYNILEGGTVSRRKKIVYQYDIISGNLVGEYEGLEEASSSIGVHVSSLSSAINNNSSSGGYFWSFIKLKKFPIHELVFNKEKEVSVYDLNGNFIRTFKSISEAAQWCSGERSAIKKACRNEIKSAYGFKWSCSEILKEKKYNNTAKAVMKISPVDNSILQVYPSISSASRDLGKTETSGIRRALDKENRTAYGFIWKTAQGSTTKDS